MPTTPLPISTQRALALIREVAADSGRYSIPNPPAGGEWYRLTTRRQGELCLREGEVFGEPSLDERGSVHLSLERFCAGVLVRVGVIVWKNEHNEWRISVNTVEQQP